MTVWEALFGTPERAERAIDEMAADQIDFCYLMDAISDNRDVKCAYCIYEYDPWGCERKDMTVLEWLKSEVIA